MEGMVNQDVESNEKLRKALEVDKIML